MQTKSVATRREAFRNAIARFHRDESASMSVEAVLVVPLLIWAFLAIYSFFDAYRARSLALKANYAISDLLSREGEAINMAYLEGTEKLFEFLTETTPDPWIRVTTVYCESRCDEEERVLRRDWSRATDGVTTYTNAGVMQYLEPIVPWLAEEERVIVVETSVEYTPPLNEKYTGIGPRTFMDVVMTRPRFAPNLCFEGVECNTDR